MTVRNIAHAVVAGRNKRAKYNKIHASSSEDGGSDGGDYAESPRRSEEIVPADFQAFSPRPNVTSLAPTVPPVLEIEDIPSSSDKAEEQPEEENLPATAARRMFCPYCDRTVLTTVELQATGCSFMVALSIFFCCGWLSLCLLPFIWSLLQTAVHRCPLCQEKLSSRSRVTCFQFREQIVTLRIGTCAIVLSRRYIIGILSMLSLLLLTLSVRWYLAAVGFPDALRGEVANATWTEFLEDCGVKSYLGNPLKAEALFEEKYADHTVRWQGRMHHVQEGFFSKHFIYIDMDPPYYPRNDYRDLVLIFGKTLLPGIATVDVGDEILFEATLLELGRRGRPHLGVIWGLNVTTKAIDLPRMDKGPVHPFVILQKTLRSSPLRLDKMVGQQLYKAHQSLAAANATGAEAPREEGRFRIVMFPLTQEKVHVVSQTDDAQSEDDA